tara:strand:- start:448 stop:666 length:219 start_codon:yes stop_codon:yes gene_type:complete
MYLVMENESKADAQNCRDDFRDVVQDRILESAQLTVVELTEWPHYADAEQEYEDLQTHNYSQKYDGPPDVLN